MKITKLIGRIVMSSTRLHEQSNSWLRAVAARRDVAQIYVAVRRETIIVGQVVNVRDALIYQWYNHTSNDDSSSDCDNDSTASENSSDDNDVETEIITDDFLFDSSIILPMFWLYWHILHVTCAVYLGVKIYLKLTTLWWSTNHWWYMVDTNRQIKKN